MSRVMIGIPCYQMVPPEVLEDYMRLAFWLGRRDPDNDYFLGIKTKSEQFRARNSIVQAAYQAGADYLFMMDDDHIVDIDGASMPSDRYGFLKKLISHMESDPSIGIVGALYYHRGGECRPVLMREHDGAYFYMRDDEIRHELQDVAVQGGGAMLIRMTVFDKIGVEPFEPEHEYGTDVQICRKAAQAGFRVCSDTSIELGHVLSSRTIITGRNRHQHYAQTMDAHDGAAANHRLAGIYRAFRRDVIEYLGVSDLQDLLNLAKQYPDHQAKFAEYRESGRLADFYRDGGSAYLARACFLKSEANLTGNSQPFDDFVLSTVKTNVPAVGVDFGCGAGVVTFELAKGGHRVHFIDIDGSPTYEFLKWRCAKYGLTGVSAFFDWPNEPVDYVIALDSIEHLEDWRGTLDRFAAILKPEAALITNFALNKDRANPEHIFMDHAAAISHLAGLRMYPLNLAVYQYRPEFEATK